MNNRKSFLDVLRIAATCAVVLLHTVTGVMDSVDMSAYPVQNTVFLVVMDLITWCVPIFVLISGYLFLNPKKEVSFRKMCSKYCKRILLALFLFGVPFACMELVLQERTFGLGTLGRAFLMVCTGDGWSHMWYLYLILLLYLLTPALKVVLRKIPRASVCFIMMFLFVGSSLFPFLNKLWGGYTLPMLSDGWIYLFYYLGGYLFVTAGKKGNVESENKSQSKSESKSESLGSVNQNGSIGRYAAIAGVIVLAAGMVCSRLFGEYQVRMAYNYPFTVMVALLLFYFAQVEVPKKGAFAEVNAQLPKDTLPKDTLPRANKSYLGALCFAVYLIHPVFLNFCYKFLHITPLQYPIWISLPGMFAVVLLLSFVGAAILHKIPLLKKYVL